MHHVLEQIRKIAPVYTDMHFVYTGDEHGADYVDLRILGRRPEHASILRAASLLLLQRIIDRTAIDLTKPIALVGPEKFGSDMVKQIFYAPGDELSHIVPDRSVLRIHTFKKTSPGKFKWGIQLQGSIERETQVIWFDDMLNAGSTFKKTSVLVEKLGARVIAIGVIGDRSGLTASDLKVRHIEVLDRFSFKRYKASKCPLCKAGRPVVRNPGHGYEYERTHPHYSGGFVSL